MHCISLLWHYPLPRHNPTHCYHTGLWASHCHLHTVHLLYICNITCMAFWLICSYLEHGFSDLQPHATCCKRTFGATDTLPCIETMISSSWIQTNFESSCLGMLYSSATLQMSTWSRAPLICSLVVSSVGGKFLIFGDSFVLLNIRYRRSFSESKLPSPIQQREETNSRCHSFTFFWNWICEHT